MSQHFDILLLGDPNLRHIAQPVEDVTSPQNQQLFSELMAFVLDCKGMGIAATQVGIEQRFFIMSSHPNSRYPQAPHMDPTVVINPEIISRSESTSKDWEGCLSVPGVRALVPRYDKVLVRYTLVDGSQVEREYSDFLARVFQHEYDHLDGMVFLDRVETSYDMMVEAQWQVYMAK
jgi:peptide deformylase